MVTVNADNAAGHDPASACLYDLFAAQAARTPDSPALAFESGRLSYAGLQARAERLAARLQAEGVGPETIVGLFVERSLEMIVGILGILRAGGAYLPIDPVYPAERVAFMLADAGASRVLTQEALAARLPAAGAALCLDSFDWAAPAPAAAAAGTGPANLAYVIYTSGSTGKPKGVGIEQRNIVNYVRGIVERFALEPGWNYATVSTIAADLGNTVIFPALASGGCVHVIAQARAENQALLEEYFVREGIDVLKIVPSHLAALQTGPHPERVMPRRRLILGGEASRLAWIRQLRALAPECEIFNHYGPTETTVGVLTYHVGRSLPATGSGTLPLGQPLPGSDISILDEALQPVAAGMAGELCIRGAGVGRGYLNRPELTAEKFIADPFAETAGGRLYRTGDRARLLPDGNVEFCGRTDHQVKINGYRVELGEIEKLLREQGGIRDVVVVAGEESAEGRQLAAYLVPKRQPQPLWDVQSLHFLPDGAPVAHLNRNETDYIYHEVFTLQAYLRHGIEIADGDCIVDAGANIGLFTLFASRLARQLHIVAIEPNPAAFACLAANAAAWGDGVRCLPYGLSSADKSAEMTFFEGLSLLSAHYASAAVEHGVVRPAAGVPRAADGEASPAATAGRDRLRAQVVPTQMRTLSGLFAEEGLARIDLLKINVEQDELDILRGIAEADWAKIRQLVIEVERAEDIAPIRALLAAHGFTSLAEPDPLRRETDRCYLYALRPPPAGAGLRAEALPATGLRPLPPPSPEVLTPASLRRYLKAQLPPYMIPSAFALLERMPLTPNGKLDRHALAPVASLVGSSRQAASGFAPPRTDTEQALAAIWAELLKRDAVGVNDDFFDLGGQSLTAIRVISRIRERFGVNLPLRNLFDHPTVAGLAAVVDGFLYLSQAPAEPAASAPTAAAAATAATAATGVREEIVL